MTAPSKVLVIGESIIDIVVSAPAAAEEVIGGSPANVAVGLARLGTPVRFATALARDERGERIAQHLAQSGVRLDAASWDLERTSTARAVIGTDGQAAYTFDLSWRLSRAVRTDGVALVHAGSLAMFLEPGAGRTLEALRRAGSEKTVVSIDPNIRGDLLPDHAAVLKRFEDAARWSDLVKLSDEDSEWLYGGAAIDDTIDRLLSLGVRLVAVTRGASGSTLATAGLRVQHPARHTAVTDTVGAGDAFQSALIAWILGRRLSRDEIGGLDRSSLHELADFASRAAAWTVQQRGAEPPTRAQLQPR